MHIADHAIVALYFLGIAAIGFWSVGECALGWADQA